MPSISGSGAAIRPPLLHIADRALNRPLLLHPDKAAIVLDVLAGRIGVDGADLAGLSPDASRFVGGRMREDGRVGMSPVADGVAVITIEGSLVNRGAWIGASSGLVSYEGVAAQVAEAEADPSVHSVILDIDSGGGEAGGVKVLSDRIAALAKTKRVVAVVNDVACSAAYWIASAASEIVVSETSMVGSIGVVMLHMNRSGELQQKGWTPTLIYSGARKVDGNSMGPLPDDVRAEFQSMTDGLYTKFVEGVAANRGKRLTAEQARATEARVFYGEAAIAAGLADRLGTFDSALAELKQRRATPAARNRKGYRMDTNENRPAAEAIYTQAEMDAAVTKATAAERGRVATILDSDAARSRPATARKLALGTDMSAEAAAAFMADLPAEAGVSGYKTIAERAAETPECGGDGTSADAAAKEANLSVAAAKGFSAAVDRINASR